VFWLLAVILLLRSQFRVSGCVGDIGLLASFQALMRQTVPYFMHVVDVTDNACLCDCKRALIQGLLSKQRGHHASQAAAAAAALQQRAIQGPAGTAELLLIGTEPQPIPRIYTSRFRQHQRS